LPAYSIPFYPALLLSEVGRFILEPYEDGQPQRSPSDWENLDKRRMETQNRHTFQKRFAPAHFGQELPGK
jgi:hypothetical protein